jgi:ferritin
MLKKEIQDVLNKQIAMEEYASRSYLVLALWAEESGYEGTAKFFFKQTEEEQGHMMKFIKFVLEAGGSPEVSTYGEGLHKPKFFKDLFEIALKHEQAVTKSIHSMVEKAWNSKDFATFNFLQWFVAEQVEEEDQFRTILDKIKIIDQQGGSYYMLDRELAMRAE